MIWEWVAAIFGIAYVILAAQQNIWCWPAGLINVSITFFVVIEQALYGYAFVQIIYFFMTINAWYLWRKKAAGRNSFPVRSLSGETIPWLIFLSSIVLLIFWFLFSYPEKIIAGTEPSPYPLLETMGTTAFVIGTWMLSRKILENWFMWIFGDIIYAYVLFMTQSYALSVLSGVFVFVAMLGYRQWKKTMKQPA
jgi:nicotinamide mononucleotide transporter